MSQIFFGQKLIIMRKYGGSGRDHMGPLLRFVSTDKFLQERKIVICQPGLWDQVWLEVNPEQHGEKIWVDLFT